MLSATVSKLEEKIQNDHCQSVICQEKIDCMLISFQGEEAINKQMNGDFTYFIVKQQKQTVGYFAVAVHEECNNIQISML